MKLLGFLVAAASCGIANAAVIGSPARDEVKANASPIPPTPGGGQTCLIGARNPNFRRNGPLALARIYRKYGVPLPEHLQHAIDRMQRLDGGDAPLIAQPNDAEYLFPVYIGTPAQAFMVDIDTGSSDFWVFSTQMPQAQIGNHTAYDPAKSSTSRKVENATWSITYGDGSSSAGNVYLDNVEIGNISFADQGVEAAKRVSPGFTQDTTNQGVFGLAFDKLNSVYPEKQATFFSNMLSKLDEPVFTVDLKHNDVGHLDFGYINPDAYVGDITYFSANDTIGWWAFDSFGYAIGDGTDGFVDINEAAIADTGATLLMLPRSLVDDYYSNVAGATYDVNNGGYTFRCGAAVPDLVLRFGNTGVGFTVPGEFIRYAPTEGENEGDMDLCFGGLQSNAWMGISVFGDIFLKSVFAVFETKEGETPRIGFAKKNL